MAEQKFSSKFADEFYRVKYDCDTNNYVAATHKIKIFGELHGIEMMMCFLVTITASLEKEQQAELATAFYDKVVGLRSV